MLDTITPMVYIDVVGSEVSKMEDWIRQTLRLPPELDEKIRLEGAKKRKSKNALIIERLLQSYEKDPFFFGSISEANLPKKEDNYSGIEVETPLC